jgi:hypothetical protein
MMYKSQGRAGSRIPQQCPACSRRKAATQGRQSIQGRPSRACQNYRKQRRPSGANRQQAEPVAVRVGTERHRSHSPRLKSSTVPSRRLQPLLAAQDCAHLAVVGTRTKVALLLGALVALALQRLIIGVQIRVVAALLATGPVNGADFIAQASIWFIFAIPSIATFAAFLLCIARFPGLSPNQRLIWTGACVVVGPLAWIVFWFVRILRQPASSGLQTCQSVGSAPRS